MKNHNRFGFFFVLLTCFFTASWSLNIDSLPVWNDNQNQIKDEIQIPVKRDSLKLKTQGSKSLQVVVGDGGTQVDQELRLSIQGEISPSVYVDALLSDVGRSPADQNTATLQEVDQIYFRVESPHVSLHLGDFSWKHNEFGLLGLERSSLGIGAALRYSNVEVRGAYGSDELTRDVHVFNGVDGQRSGYIVSSGGLYQTIVPGSEKVWINGSLLKKDLDYDLNYAGGVLDFKGTQLPGAQDEIRVEYDSYASQSISTLKAFEGRYRSKNIWLDVGGFRLSSDVERLKRGTWTENDYEKLKADTGTSSLWSDSLGALERPLETDRMSARIRAQAQRRFFLDAEIAYQKKDTNTISDFVGGPVGRASRWLLSSDTSTNLNHFPLAVSLYGNYYEMGFLNTLFQGTDRDWESYRLNEEWDLDSSLLTNSLRHDHLKAEWRLPLRFFTGIEMGYRQSADTSLWNASRGRFFLDHRHQKVRSSLSLVRVNAVQLLETERYQGILETRFLEGFFRPFGLVSYTFWNKDSLGNMFYSDRIKGNTGFETKFYNIKVSEDLAAQQSRRGVSKENLEDSLVLWQWTQKVEMEKKYFQLTNLLHYKNAWNDSMGTADTWLGEISFVTKPNQKGISLSTSYELGLTNEQAYVPVYKAVAAGTGDVLYDSLTGTFIEGVDNGNFVYEGMGRVDSLGAVRASTAAIDLNAEWSPAKMFAIKNGFLRDISFTLQGHFEGRDTTGKTIYAPPFRKKTLESLTNGLVHYEGSLLWLYPTGFASVVYSMGYEDEKKNSVFYYFQNKKWHSGEVRLNLNTSNEVTFSLKKEQVDLISLQQMNWILWDIKASWKRSLFSYFSVEPGAFFRKGDGIDEISDLNLFLKQGNIKLSWEKSKVASAFALFSATHVSTEGYSLPYQMNSGFSEGLTYRIEANASFNINDYLSFSLRYLIRFGDAEENIFQKWTTEAKAYF